MWIELFIIAKTELFLDSATADTFAKFFHPFFRPCDGSSKVAVGPFKEDFAGLGTPYHETGGLYRKFRKQSWRPPAQKRLTSSRIRPSQTTAARICCFKTTYRWPPPSSVFNSFEKYESGMRSELCKWEEWSTHSSKDDWGIAKGERQEGQLEDDRCASTNNHGNARVSYWWHLQVSGV